MTTKPKAKKFRIRRSSPLAASLGAPAGEAGAGTAEPPSAAPPGDLPAAAPAAPAARPQLGTPAAQPLPVAGNSSEPPAPLVSPPSGRRQPPRVLAEDGDGNLTYPTLATEAADDVAASGDLSAEQAIAAIRREGLTGRQLRMARRLAHRHGLSPISDHDAVRQLRLRGIDPFERSNMLELVVPGGSAPRERVQLPQTIDAQPDGANVPSTELRQPETGEEARARQILAIQRDIARRRRRKMMLLLTRLACFVGLPTVLAGYYYYAIATPMYATNSEFVIQQAETPSAGGLGGLFSGTSFATSQDSITVQSYLTSRDAMLRLDSDAGFKRHFSEPVIDPIQRLPADATNEQAYRLYRKNVKIGYDPSEGIVKMEVVAPDPALSAEYSRRLIGYAEEQVDNLTQRLRADQMAGARESYQEAEAKMTAAQGRVLELQEKLGVLDPASESSTVMSQVATFETDLQQKRLELQQLLSNRAPNQARVDGVRGDIRRLEQLVAALRSQLTDSTSARGSLANVSAQLRVAEVDLQTRTLMMQQALQQLEAARIEANRQVRYLSMGVAPVAPDEATYPRAFENTLLAFLVFAGIYLMISLTASILREQVSG